LKGNGQTVRYDPKIAEVFKKLFLALGRLQAGFYGELKGLSLIYIHYSICNDDDKVANWQNLAVFNQDVGDSDQTFSLLLQNQILDVLY
jgi:hypothetical protein